MYLLVFATLMIGIIGTYAQVMGLQAARMASNQSGIGSAMLQWHAAAVSMAASIIKTNTLAYPGGVGGPGSVGCSLTFTSPPVTGMAQCPSPTLYGGYPPATEVGTVTSGGVPPVLNLIANQTTSMNECVHLSAICTGQNATFGCAATKCVPSYDIHGHQFYSVLYRDATTSEDYVITFLPAPVISATNPAPGYLSMVNGTALSLSTSGLLQQLNQAGAPNYSYGAFQNFGTLAPQLVTASGTYNLPSAGNFTNLCNGSATCVANGGVAMIATPDGF